MAEARVAFQRGQDDYQSGRYSAALTQFASAYQLLHEPAFLYNIAQCYRRLGRLDDAERFYHDFLNAVPDGARGRDEAAKALEEIAAERAKSAELHAQMAAAEQARATAEAAELARIRATASSKDRVYAHRRKWAGVGLFSLGLASLVGGTASALIAHGARSDLTSAANQGAVYDPAITDKARHADSATIALFAAGGALTVLGVSLLGSGIVGERAR
jgi:tetratricopeptide (TPR) repeat protein